MINERRLRISGRLQKTLRQKSSRRLVVRYGLILANVLVLGAVATFVVNGSRSNNLAATVGTPAGDSAVNPVDGLTAYDVAASVARSVELEEVLAIDNQAQSARAMTAMSVEGSTVTAKPQIVATDLKSREDIRDYIVQPGDDAASIAQKFGITADSVKWSNGLLSSHTAQGTKLAIPPINGVVYTVKAGDTPQTLATKFQANAEQIIAANDAEIGGLKAGERILIPNGRVLAPTSLYGSLRSSFSAVYGSNGYPFGYCTYYAAARSGAPSNWGNANTWAYYARLSGWTVSSAPRVGAIAQTSGMSYFGHVAIVEQVSEDGSQIIFSDMNGIKGFRNVGTSGWVPASKFEHYIYK